MKQLLLILLSLLPLRTVCWKPMILSIQVLKEWRVEKHSLLPSLYFLWLPFCKESLWLFIWEFSPGGEVAPWIDRSGIVCWRCTRRIFKFLRFDSNELLWKDGIQYKNVSLTGGEPQANLGMLTQLLWKNLVDALRRKLEIKEFVGNREFSLKSKRLHNTSRRIVETADVKKKFETFLTGILLCVPGT